MKEIVISVAKSRYRSIEDPFGQYHSARALVNVDDLPSDLPIEVNPRNQNTQSRVARQITTSLNENPEEFHIFNRGITLTVSEAIYDNRSQKLVLKFPSPHYGVIDGGHTYACINENKDKAEEEGNQESKDKHAFVMLEILIGIKSTNMIVDLARARNTSSQVKDESLANLQGSFDWVKEALTKTSYIDKIAWRENEDADERPLDIREIIGFLTMFHPQFDDPDMPPIQSYGSKGRCLEMFTASDETIQKGYRNLRNVLPDILALYDYVHKEFEPMYRKIGGLSSLGEEKKTSVKLGKVVEVKHIKDGFPLYYLGDSAFFRFPDGWLYPVVAAHRALLIYKGVYKWACDPRLFFDKYGQKLVELTLNASRELGRNPNAVGKAKNHWIQLHDKVINHVLRLTGGKEEEIKL